MLSQTKSPKVVVPTAEVVVQAIVSEITQKGATEAGDSLAISLGPEIHAREEMGSFLMTGLLQGSTTGDAQTPLSIVTVMDELRTSKASTEQFLPHAQTPKSAIIPSFFMQMARSWHIKV